MPEKDVPTGGRVFNIGDLKPEVMDAFARGEKEKLELRVRLLTTFWEKHPELNIGDIGGIAPVADNSGGVCCIG